MSELARCANCAAPLTVDDRATSAVCQYCGYETLFRPVATPDKTASGPSGAPTGPTLVETIHLKASAHLLLPLIERGAALPVARTETLSTSSDDQEVLHVNLVAGNFASADQNRELATIAFPLESRAPRGTVQVQMTIEVDVGGAVLVALLERGTQNALEKHDLPRVDVRR